MKQVRSDVTEADVVLRSLRGEIANRPPLDAVMSDLGYPRSLIVDGDAGSRVRFGDGAGVPSIAATPAKAFFRQLMPCGRLRCDARLRR